MINLSVNVNKIATLRNSRGGNLPSVTQAAQTCIDAGAQGITAHPRQDQRHIKPHDVYELAEMVTVEYNIEGDPRPDFLDMVTEICPTQCTLVPVVPGEITSHTVWNLPGDGGKLKPIIQRLKDAGIRVSLFSGTDLQQIELSREVGADRVEFYTEPYASAKTNKEVEHQFGLLVRAAEKAVEVGVGINAGHDLNLDNLPPLRNLPLLEVSIGHHLINDAIYMGLENAVKAYRKALGQKVK
ncbi:MAG: pyridoxine 5'-phosphate synthase [Candidatus Poribacteria bacterium]|nr:pyridoxine 5'-phosphate synthase [Candidatus Poribacteria bacterium]MDE0506972.1 pyridoxine 5'-phosphate synthase [Candidatus Poribacteria bacterium]